jgi:hypothetical protein
MHSATRQKIYLASSGKAYNGYYSRSAPLVVPGFPVAMSIVYDAELTQYQLAFLSASTRVRLLSGSVSVKWDSTTVLALDLKKGLFPPIDTDRLFDPLRTRQTSCQNACIDVSVELDWEETKAGQSTTDLERLIFAEASLGTLPFLFPLFLNSADSHPVHSSHSHSSTKRCLLQVSSHRSSSLVKRALLCTASPYLKQLLTSAFFEGTASTNSTSTAAAFDDYAFAESDDETDKMEQEKRMTKQSDPNTPFKTITVTDTAYSTYLAVLIWLQSRHITFAPLLSSFRKDGQTSDQALSARSGALPTPSASKNPLFPLPASPKSVYRLAHLLEIDELAALALDNLRSQLTPQNAAYELYSDVATCYPAVRDIVLDFILDNLDGFRTAKATEEMQGKAEAGELDAGTAGTAMLLAQRVMEKLGKV